MLGGLCGFNVCIAIMKATPQNPEFMSNGVEEFKS
jgi:hypothetical protein